ncbi:unnamed protein product [Lathyrus sativus]|nr:unnamed protein product [Lathyrus sativus]
MKRKLIGININSHFLDVAANFLSCRLEGLEFNFLGVPIGLNSKRIYAWDFLIHKRKAQISNWKGRMLYLGDHITLLKSIWSSLPIFLFSFYRAPVKWKRRILEGKKALWIDILRARYDIQSHHDTSSVNCNNTNSRSAWWKDITSLEKRHHAKDFKGKCRFTLEGGSLIPLWSTFWFGEVKLQDELPDLYNISSLKKEMAAGMGKECVIAGFGEILEFRLSLHCQFNQDCRS